MNIDGHRFTTLPTTQQDADLAAVDRRHRAHRIEQRIRDAKAIGLGNPPSADAATDQIWLQLVLLAQDPLAWFAVLALDGEPGRRRTRHDPLPAASHRPDGGWPLTTQSPPPIAPLPRPAVVHTTNTTAHLPNSQQLLRRPQTVTNQGQALSVVSRNS